ncbi:DUF3347 domain-containing protein [Pontibacter sp. SGAir0037]|uniref:DUF3347 domain-containing protein n=1 Tax=Pontibacter sp. SGAir0037 TaxID=2571030 RepID=UPI0010CD54B5|nr:DUF3347 domain-containing protein [Pontibacter sp. SGAir0037]QCR22840.1 hypothetical protein C1N53_11125 [Pontibacter sp. SGAir0037]
MKKNVLRIALWAMVAGAGTSGMVACSGNTDNTENTDQLKQTEEEAAVETVNAKYSTPEGFVKAADSYLALKDGLVESKAAEAQLRASELVVDLQKVDASALETEVAAEWTKMAGTLQNDANTIASTTDLASQREAFTSLSNNMIKAVETFGADKTMYLQHCPMANNNNGGSWLSSNEEIRNPYYGDAMLKCGEVQAAINTK